MRVLQTIAAAVPVRLMKRDLLFIAEQMLSVMDDKRLEIVARRVFRLAGIQRRPICAIRLPPVTA
jgi:hypothetical protein